jgi:hypothetical protein
VRCEFQWFGLMQQMVNSFINIAMRLLFLFLISAAQLFSNQYWVDEVIPRGYVWTSTDATRLTGDGQVLGHVMDDEGIYPFLWHEGLFEELTQAKEELDLILCELVDLNDQGLVVGRGCQLHGSSDLSHGPYRDISFFWDLERGEIKKLPHGCMVRRLNNRNQMVVARENDYQLWDGEVHQTIASGRTYFTALNDQGQVLVRTERGFAVWQDGAMVRTVTGTWIADPATGLLSDYFDRAMNNLGDVVGLEYLFKPYIDPDRDSVMVHRGLQHLTAEEGASVFIWLHDGGRIRVGGPKDSLHPISLNDRLELVGKKIRNRQSAAFLWTQQAGLTDLNTIVQSRWWLEEALAINNRGQILAVGTNSKGQTQLLLLTPTDS